MLEGGAAIHMDPSKQRNDPVEKSRSSTEANANSGAAMKAKHVQGYVRHSVASKSREGVVSPPTQHW